jgi:uncharacterized membrane protein
MAKRKDKKDIIENKAAPSSGGKGVYGIAIGIVIVAAIAFVMLGGGTASGVTEVKAESGAVTLAVSDVSDGQAHYYRYHNAQGLAIKFFVLKSSDGVIRAAFDACDVCYPEKKGYRQEGDLMVCNNCGQQFPSVRINEVKGGCNPSPLARSVQGDKLVFKAADIESGSFYF